MTKFGKALKQLTKDAIQASLDKIAEEMAAKFGPTVRNGEYGWLVEMKQDLPNAQPRWWHPKDGWVLIATDALRFARRKDAEDYIASSDLSGFATNHIWVESANDQG